MKFKPSKPFEAVVWPALELDPFEMKRGQLEAVHV